MDDSHIFTLADMEPSAMWDKCLIALAREHQRQLSVLLYISSQYSPASNNLVCICNFDLRSVHHFHRHQIYCPFSSSLSFTSSGFTEESGQQPDWDLENRYFLEQLVLSEFVRKISRQYVLYQTELHKESFRTMCNSSEKKKKKKTGSNKKKRRDKKKTDIHANVESIDCRSAGCHGLFNV